jgi:hypothetical protein
MFTEMPGNFNMLYVQLKHLLCVAVLNVKTIKCVWVKRLKYEILIPRGVCAVLWLWTDFILFYFILHIQRP